jgi:cell division septal protein FtsQ
VVLLAGALGAFAVVQGEGLLPRVSELTVGGNDKASTVALRHLADVRDGASLMTVDLDALVEGVSRHPWVASATVRRVFPDSLHVIVTEHETRMLVLLRGLYRVDHTGDMFARARSTELDLPVLTGLDPAVADESPVAARGVVRQALRTLALLEATGAADLDQVSEVAFDLDLGFSLVLRNGSRIHFGYQDPALQARRLADLRAAGLDLSLPHEVDLDLSGMALATPLKAMPLAI